MKLIFKGKFKSYDELPKNELPENAVKFKEPSSFLGLNLLAVAFAVPVMILLIVLAGTRNANFFEYNFPGFITALLLCVPHELIHGMCAGRDADVYMYYSLKHLMMFVLTPVPMSKTRFILFSAMPSLLLGWLPFLIGLVFFPTLPFGKFIMAVGFYGAIMGSGDCINIFNAAVQMPKGSLTMLSGMNSYWYLLDDKLQ